MKNIASLIAASLLCALALLPVAGIATITTGCKSTQQATAYRSIASVQASTEIALGVWQDYVKSRKREIAAMTEGSEQNAAVIQLASRELKARAALESYKTAAVVAITAAKSGAAPAPAPLLAAATKFTEATSL